ncbi:hypothetical protein JB92DRAFT_3111729 [Gautieria morchelliformis]|nr:hypothetical protein JB92DRAFT_3111729 [Gautieria morchelliformis]
MQLITSVALLLVAAAGVLAQPMINTPASITECQPTQLGFSGGQPPYFLSILPGGQVGAAPIENLGTQSGTSLTWNADIASGTSITFQIKDSTGATAFSAIVTVQAGSDTSCVGKNSLTSGSASGTASGSASGSASSAATSGASKATSAPATSAASATSVASKPASSGASTAGATSAASAASGSAASASASPSSSTTPNSAKEFNAGSASGVIGILLAALLI